jgi:hypothetical protein
MKAGRCFVQAVAVLAVFAVARSLGLLGPAVISVSLLTAALILIAWSAGRTPPVMKKVGQAQRRGRRGSRSAKARQTHAASTPSP